VTEPDRAALLTVMRKDGPCPLPVDLAAAVDAAREGDEAAFGMLYREVHPGLLRYLRGLVGDDAEDVASEVWLQIARDIRSFREEGAGVRAWAVTIARHRALDHLRKLRRRPADVVPAEVLVDLPDSQDTADQAITAAATKAAIALIATLPRDQAEVILLRTVVGLDARAVGEVLGKRPGSVRTTAWRGLRRLAALLEREPCPGHPAAVLGAGRDARAEPAPAPVTKSSGSTPEDTR
jgi:RNA polymerase sigma-70 factor (ECF subfamily)